MATAHWDHFCRDHLPPAAAQPEYCFDLPSLQFPEQLNCASELLDRAIERGWGERTCILAPGGWRWSYQDLLDRANQIAHVLVTDMGLKPGERVLLRGPNNPMLAACWFAIIKAGGVAVATMPLLRAAELVPILEKAAVQYALCDASLADELSAASITYPGLRAIHSYNGAANNTAWPQLEQRMATQPSHFSNVDTAADDTCLLAFTSGTTGVPKATMHFHRDVMAICACWPEHVLKPTADDIFIGSPPLAFTFGLGGLLLFPMAAGAATVLLEKAGPPMLLEAIAEFGATIAITAPTSYRAMAPEAAQRKLGAQHGGSLRKSVSAGEALPAATRQLWRDATGIEIIDGIGATEMLHIFISADEAHARPGATGKPIPGYYAQVVDDQDQILPPGQIGKLRVKGPTGCRYMADERQKTYVRHGWNYTGDAYWVDEDGYFFYSARTDDMIISAGYNIAAPEVENALMQHPAVAECGVYGQTDAERGQIVTALVVVRSGNEPSDLLVKALQEHVKQTIAPYKYPRSIQFVTALPRTQTGKLQRFKLPSWAQEAP